jgi:hypothetical protein
LGIMAPASNHLAQRERPTKGRYGMLVKEAERQLQMRDALLPLAGVTGYRHLLTMMYSGEVLCAAGVAPHTMARLASWIGTHGVEALPRHEIMLESDSKSRIYVVQTQLEDEDHVALVLKWYSGRRQPYAAVEQQMNQYFRQCLTPHAVIGPILAVVPLEAVKPLSVAILPYLGAMTLYDYLHHLPVHAAQVETLLRQASDTLAYTQVLGHRGHDAQVIRLTSLAPTQATTYFLHQISSVVVNTFATSGQPLSMAEALLEHFTFFATVLAADSCTAGLYYRGINPRNIMWANGQQIDIDFEQDTLRSRFIDIVSLLENGLEMERWDETVDYPSFHGQMPFAVWDAQRHRAWEALAHHNYLSHAQVEALTADFLDTTWRLERQHLAPERAAYSAAERRLLLATARVFRHLQYVGYCKRNEQQALTPSKRISSRYRQQFHALWAKCVLDNLLFPRHPAEACLPEAGRPATIALRQTLDALPLTD